MLKTSLIGALTLLLTLSLTGCGGNETKTTVQNQETQGQQLIDLKKAYDEGIITEKEYHRTKNEILDQN